MYEGRREGTTEEMKERMSVCTIRKHPSTSTQFGQLGKEHNKRTKQNRNKNKTHLKQEKTSTQSLQKYNRSTVVESATFWNNIFLFSFWGKCIVYIIIISGPGLIISYQ